MTILDYLLIKIGDLINYIKYEIHRFKNKELDACYTHNCPLIDKMKIYHKDCYMQYCLQYNNRLKSINSDYNFSKGKSNV
jgi:hypothetical protein